MFLDDRAFFINDLAYLDPIVFEFFRQAGYIWITSISPTKIHPYLEYRQNNAQSEFQWFGDIDEDTSKEIFKDVRNYDVVNYTMSFDSSKLAYVTETNRIANGLATYCNDHGFYSSCTIAYPFFELANYLVSASYESVMSIKLKTFVIFYFHFDIFAIINLSLIASFILFTLIPMRILKKITPSRIVNSKTDD